MQRNIFGYRLRDGSQRFADPLVLEWRLTQALGGDMDSVVAQALLPTNPDGSLAKEEPSNRLLRHAAEEKLAKASLLAFELPEFDSKTGEGYTANEALAIMWAWFDWMDSTKKNSATPLSGATGSPESPPPSSQPLTSPSITS